MPYKDLEKRSLWKREWAKRNPDKIKAYNQKHNPPKKNRIKKSAEEIKCINKIYRKTRIKKCTEYIQSIKNNSKCSNCPENDPSCLVFHHVNESEKEYDISRMKKMSIKSVQKEIDKCIILCSNCHMKLHAKQKLEQFSC